MKLATWNIRGDFGVDGRNDFSCRKPLIKKRIAAETPDVIGFQEVMPHVQRWLRQELEGYTVVGCGRSADYGDEAMTLAVRDETCELLGFEVFWLSPEPWRPGSRYREQSECPRTCAAAVVNCRDLGGPVRIYNTHLDHLGAEARRLGLVQILERMARDQARLPLPAALLGDFNAVPGARELAPLAAWTAPALRDVTGHIPFTYHGFFQGEAPCKIDYIFLSPQLRAEAVEAWTEEEGGVYLSDHYPVCARLRL